MPTYPSFPERIISDRLSRIGAMVTPLTDGWTMILTSANTCALPAEVDVAKALRAPVPGTVASALLGAGLFDPAAPAPLDHQDAWYFRDLAGEQPGEAVLRFEGLATIADIYLNGERLLQTESMFECHDLPVTLTGHDMLAICFRALRPRLEAVGPRARWRPKMMDHQGLRLVRTTLLGHMPGWCPDIHAAGPFRPVSILRPSAMPLTGLALQATLTGPDQGRLVLEFSCPAGADFALSCNGREAKAENRGAGRWRIVLDLPGIEPWFPHTHGRPRLYPVNLRHGESTWALPPTGFRSLSVDKGDDGKGFGLVVNGVAVFARGAVWTSADIVTLSGTEADYLPLLQLAVEAGMNMIRIGGTMTYESPAFFACCDRLGLMVWQDFMLANFDYPVRDESFVSHISREAEDLLLPIMASPSLAVLCGGSEMYQQAAMLGLPQSLWQGALTEEILARASSSLRPDVIYVPNSPFGGAMPFAPNAGVTHYYGVGAYERPLEDARRTDVRFSAESLAFSQVPHQRTLDRHLPVAPVHDPRWKARVPRDRDASWDFEDTRDHYLGLLYGVEPARLRREDPARYLDLSRAVTGEVSEAVFAEWRRHGSRCRGGLVWTLRDLVPGAGWGVIDSTGEPKPVYHALKRAFRPVQISLMDEGTNGLDIHVLNETGQDLDLLVELSCLRDGQTPVVSGRWPVRLAARQSALMPATDLFGAFFDTTYAFRFGPPSHEVTVARLRLASTDEVIADAFHFPLGRSAALFPARIEAALSRDDHGWMLMITADRLAQSVHVDVDGYRALDDWFHLAPGVTRTIRLAPRPDADEAALPAGSIQSLGARTPVRF